ncbi:Ribosome modulation factor domain-containing protein [Dioscorea alata]|uniref:Ribosome modulation factor domain-containing protein n=1 Tax=Dioscorea alata TaxID=55571 RepID=A0ACB7WN70_DIOAL|nr:Ribosome modulation factor domain-containing protein [Dioscorea alata]
MVFNGRKASFLLVIITVAMLSTVTPADAGFLNFFRSVTGYLYGDTCFSKQYSLCRSVMKADAFICTYSSLQMCDVWLEGWEATDDYEKLAPVNYDW